MSLYFLVINLDKNVDRYEVISKSLNELACKFERVRAINGYDMDNDEAEEVQQGIHYKSFIYCIQTIK
jgi:GR25 family glycosyltransferase involved in LPS biosynthesis